VGFGRLRVWGSRCRAEEDLFGRVEVVVQELVLKVVVPLQGFGV
jgi:hypothetical protein